MPRISLKSDKGKYCSGALGFHPHTRKLEPPYISQGSTVEAGGLKALLSIQNRAENCLFVYV